MDFISKRETSIQALAYVFGLFNSPSLSVFIAIVLVAFLDFALIPKLWPGKVLDNVNVLIDATRAHLDDEANRRRTADMYAISASGLQRLDAISDRARHLLDQHRVLFRLNCLHRYIPAAYRLCKESRRCYQDLDNLVWELDEEIIRLDRHVGVDHPLTISASRGRLRTPSRFHASTPSNDDIV